MGVCTPVGDRDATRHSECVHGCTARVSRAGADAYGLTALHKLASWNKTELLALLIPKLSAEQLNGKCPEGKTDLHWAVEMASVGAVKALVAAGVDVEAKDGKGRTVRTILDAVEQSGIIDRLKAALVSGGGAD